VSLTDARFVPIPNFYKLNQQAIQYLDILIYTALKSFDNSDDDCFPRHETVAKLVGMSKRFAIDSVKRLERAGLITVLRSAKKKVSNHYYFNSLKRFEQIPYGLLTAADLTPNEKAMLICLRQFFIHGPLQCINDVVYFSAWLGLSYNTVYPIYKSLVYKGYIVEQMKVFKSVQAGYVRKTLTDKIEWHTMHCVSPLLKAFDTDSNSKVYRMLKVA
jgi:hypothetical protein